MRAIGVTTFGGPEALEVVELPEPTPGPGEVRLRVQAAAVSPTDTLARDGARAERSRQDPPPYVPGMDAAGELDEIGEGVEHRAGGRRRRDGASSSPTGSHGGYGEEHRGARPASVAAAPAGRTTSRRRTLPMNGLTARLALDLLALAPGRRSP